MQIDFGEVAPRHLPPSSGCSPTQREEKPCLTARTLSEKPFSILSRVSFTRWLLPRSSEYPIRRSGESNSCHFVGSTDILREPRRSQMSSTKTNFEPSGAWLPPLRQQLISPSSTGALLRSSGFNSSWEQAKTACRRSPGFRIDPRLLGRPTEQLRTLTDLLEIFPGPLLERRTLEAACFEFLIAESESEDLADGIRPSEWFSSHADFVRPLLGVPGYRAALAPRQAPDGVIPWAGLPTVTLAAAIHVRRQTAQWARATRALDEALCFAPSLVTHDLIAANLLIHRLRAAGEPC